VEHRAGCEQKTSKPFLLSGGWLREPVTRRVTGCRIGIKEEMVSQKVGRRVVNKYINLRGKEVGLVSHRRGRCQSEAERGVETRRKRLLEKRGSHIKKKNGREAKTEWGIQRKAVKYRGRATKMGEQDDQGRVKRTNNVVTTKSTQRVQRTGE